MLTEFYITSLWSYRKPGQDRILDFLRNCNLVSPFTPFRFNTLHGEIVPLGVIPEDVIQVEFVSFLGRH